MATLYVRVRFVERHDTNPGFNVFDNTGNPYLEVQGYAIAQRKYSLAPDYDLGDAWDYPEFALDSATFERPFDLSERDTYTIKAFGGGTTTASYAVWRIVTVPDNFVIPINLEPDVPEILIDAFVSGMRSWAVAQGFSTLVTYLDKVDQILDARSAHDLFAEHISDQFALIDRANRGQISPDDLIQMSDARASRFQRDLIDEAGADPAVAQLISYATIARGPYQGVGFQGPNGEYHDASLQVDVSRRWGDFFNAGVDYSGFVEREGFIGGNGNDVAHLSGGNDIASGRRGNDSLYGEGGNDYLAGGEDHDRLYGGPGEDTLVGGFGYDTFVFQGPNEGADHVTDFQTYNPFRSFDQIGLSASGFGISQTGSLAAAGVRFVAGDHARENAPSILYDQSSGGLWWDSDGTGASQQVLLGVIRSSGNAAPVNVDRSWEIAALGNFRGDGTDDVLWRNQSSGDLLFWNMAGGRNIGGYNLGNVDNVWRVAAVSDFNGNGSEDILFHNRSDGDLVYWQMAGGQKIGGYGLGNVDLSWKVVGVTNLVGGPTEDIVWRNERTGEMLVWEMANGAKRNGYVLPNADLSWKVAGFGDVTGDGKQDIIWQNINSGEVLAWTIVNGQKGNGYYLGALNRNDSEIIVMDVDSNLEQILISNSQSGEYSSWLIGNGNVLQNSRTDIPTGWHLAGTGDFDAGGRHEVIFRSDTGAVAVLPPEQWLTPSLTATDFSFV